MRSPLFVIVRFEVKKEEMSALQRLINDFFTKEVKNFPGFRTYKLHENEEGTILVNYATWESLAHFQDFAAFASSSALSRQIQNYKPTADKLYELNQSC